ncbi:MAG: hypothetical protein ACLQUZ_08245 [Rhizomicrobium sp.]
MRVNAQPLAICLLASLAMWAQAGQKADQQAPQEQPQQQQQQPEERPTLGPRTGPGLSSGPLTSTTTDIRKLMRIHTLYIEGIDNSLSDKLVEALGKWGRFHIVTKEKEADAILRGSCLESRHLKRVHSEVFISDRSGGSVWQDSIYRPFNPPALDQAVSDTATLVEAHLEQTIREAERR